MATITGTAAAPLPFPITGAGVTGRIVKRTASPSILPVLTGAGAGATHAHHYAYTIVPGTTFHLAPAGVGKRAVKGISAPVAPHLSSDVDVVWVPLPVPITGSLPGGLQLHVTFAGAGIHVGKGIGATLTPELVAAGTGKRELRAGATPVSNALLSSGLVRIGRVVSGGIGLGLFSVAGIAFRLVVASVGGTTPPLTGNGAGKRFLSGYGESCLPPITGAVLPGGYISGAGIGELPPLSPAGATYRVVRGSGHGVLALSPAGLTFRSGGGSGGGVFPPLGAVAGVRNDSKDQAQLYRVVAVVRRPGSAYAKASLEAVRRLTNQ